MIAGKTVIGQLATIWKSSLDEAGIHHEVHRFSGECSLVEIERVKSRRTAGARPVRSSVPAAARSLTPPGSRSRPGLARCQLPDRCLQ